MGSILSHGNVLLSLSGRPWDRKRNQADPLLLEELYIVPRKLWLFQSFNRQGFAGSSFFFPGQNLLEPKSPHLPRSNSYGLGLRV